MEKQIYVAKYRITLSRLYALATWFYVFIPYFMMDKKGWEFENAWPVMALLMVLILFTNVWFFKVAQQQKSHPFLILRDQSMVIKHPMHKAKSVNYADMESAEMLADNVIEIKTRNKKKIKIQRLLIGNEAFEEVWSFLALKV